jgi:hypothetical protein
MRLTFTFRSYLRTDVSWNMLKPQVCSDFSTLSPGSLPGGAENDRGLICAPGKVLTWITLMQLLELYLYDCQHLSLSPKTSLGSFKQRIFLGINENEVN